MNTRLEVARNMMFVDGKSMILQWNKILGPKSKSLSVGCSKRRILLPVGEET